MTTIGVFDSGIGGLSVLRHVAVLAPAASLLYLADQANAPYGERTLAEVRDMALVAATTLLERGADEVVVACNTASAAGLEALRAARPDVPIVGMEPAVKPAASMTKTGTVAVLATEATFQGELYRALRSDFETEARIIELTGTGLATAVEEGHVRGRRIERLLAPHVDRVRSSGADVLVLGCTHYPFLTPTIEAMLGPSVTIVDPSPAVARQAVRRMPTSTGESDPRRTVLTTGDAVPCRAQVSRFFGPVDDVVAVSYPEIRPHR